MTPTFSTRAVALAAIAGSAALTLLAFAPAASASGGGITITRAGNCAAATDWKLKVKAEDGALESEFEVDSNRVGQLWSYKITDNGVLLRSGYAHTVAPSGSFTIRKVSANRAGADRFVARARNAATGELCVGTLTF